MSKITLKNKLRGGMKQSLPLGVAVGQGTSLNATSIPQSPPSSTGNQSLPISRQSSLNVDAEMLTYTPSIKEILESKPELYELFKTYDNRQKFNLINISFSTITSFLNIFVIYLEDITDIEQKLPLITQLKELLTNINNFKYRYNYNLINPETPINIELINQNIREINRLLEPIQTTEITFNNNNINNLITQINTIDNRGILYIIKQLFVIENNLFKYLITDYTTIDKILTETDKEKIIIYNKDFLMSIQTLSNYFVTNSTTLQKLTSQNTYNSTIKIHTLLYTLLDEPVSNFGSELSFNEGNIYNQVPYN